jgi:dTDP-D-glucose 4,6-dehydratase
MRNVLVTGGAGFIGSHVCDRLVAEGHRVVCADDLSLGRRTSIAHLEGRPGFRFVELDVAGEADALRALFDMNRFDTVWHLAANSDIRRGSADREVDLDRTFLSTFRVLEECAAHGTAEVLRDRRDGAFERFVGDLYFVYRDDVEAELGCGEVRRADSGGMVGGVGGVRGDGAGGEHEEREEEAEHRL